MKSATYLFLILFITFLATPTVISAINSSCDTSFFYVVSEEELTHKAVKEYNYQLKIENDFKQSSLSSSKIISENQLRHDNVTPAIFSPPPNV